MKTKTTIIDALNAYTDAKAGKDKEITKVVFLMDKAEDGIDSTPFALFPEDYYNESSLSFTCYSHVGQHSACHLSYARECKLATPEQYNDLKMELEGIGYNLNVLKSI